MPTQTSLAPGQHVIEEFPRFGLSQFANRFPQQLDGFELKLTGDVEAELVVNADTLRLLPRVEKTSDFHCVTTWTCCSLQWAGYRFADFYNEIVRSQVRPISSAEWVVFRGQDRYTSILPLADVLAPDVLLADTLNDSPLSIAHGAPLRLIAPAHYGYKNPKHLCGIEFWKDTQHYRSASLRFMDHPRARVAFEERGRGVPGWLLRLVYRPFISQAVRQFQRALDAHLSTVNQ